MEETMVKIPHRTQVPRDTVDDVQMPAAGLVATIWRTAISRNTTECASATTAYDRIELVFSLAPALVSFDRKVVVGENGVCVRGCPGNLIQQLGEEEL